MGRKRRNLGPCSCCVETCVGMCSMSPVPRYLYATCVQHDDNFGGTGYGVYNILGMSFKLENVNVSGSVVVESLCAGFGGLVGNVHNPVYYGTGVVEDLPYDDGLGNEVLVDLTWTMRSSCCGEPSPPTADCDDTPGLQVSLSWSFSRSGPNLGGHAPRPGTSSECTYDTANGGVFLNTKSVLSCSPLLVDFRFKRLNVPPYPTGGSYSMDLGFTLTT